jgi:hypothetical protein
MAHALIEIPESHKVNFGTLKTAASNLDLALMMLYDRIEKRHRPVVVAIGRDDEGNYLPTPIAVLIEDNPYERFEDPFPNEDEGTEGQDRDSYSDDQDRENYTIDPALEED